MSETDELVTAIERHTGRQGRRNGRNIRLLCPGHDDHEPSLDVAEGDNGRPIVVCRSHGCTYEQICAAVGWGPPARDEREEWTPFGPATAVYRYVDEQGSLLFEVCRTAAKQFPQRRPDPSSRSGWRWKLEGTRRVLYRLPQLLEAVNRGDTVYVVEGEKDVHALERHGVCATCNPGGAGKWLDVYAPWLAGVDVVVVADRDQAGVDHALRVARSLMGVARDVQVRYPLPTFDGADMSDHLAAGHTLEQLVPLDADASQDVLVDVHDFATMEAEMPLPLWGDETHNVIPAGGLCLLAGRPGSGKTTLVVDLAFHLAAGVPWPNRDPNNPGAPTPIPVPRPLRVALIENEGPLEMFRFKLRDKLNAFPHPIGSAEDGNGGCIVVQVWRWGSFSFADEDAHARAADELDRLNIDLVIGDPLASLGPEGVGSPADTRDFVSLLRPLGLGNKRSFLFLHHFRERVERTEDELARISGAWGGHLDTLITLSATHSDQQARLAWPKMRWARKEKPAPLILGRVWNTASYEGLGEEGDTSMLAPVVYAELARLRDTGTGRAGQGYATSTELAKNLEHRRTDVHKTLEQNPHLFSQRTGQEARALGARATAILWGLAEWDTPGDATGTPAGGDPISWAEAQTAAAELTKRTGEHIHTTASLIAEAHRLRDPDTEKP